MTLAKKISVLFLLLSGLLHANDSLKTSVFIFEIKDVIDARMSRYVEKALLQSKEKKADLLIIDMDTYGGGVQEADEIVTMLLKEKRLIYIYINKNAGSAGSFISIACDSIYMAPGSSIGASTVVNQEGQVVPEKYQSFMRTKMRSTAETKGRDPKTAEAMVGLHLQTDSAYVASFTPTEAIEANYCEGQVSSIEEILEQNNINNYSIERFTLDSTEKVISIFLNPFLKSILVLLILGGIYFELQTPGIGFPLAAAVVGLVLYFVPDYLQGLLSNWEIIIFIIGIALIFVEVFVTPGFGVMGVSGLILILASLGLSTLNNDGFDFTFVSAKAINNMLIILSTGITGTVVLFFAGGAAIAKSKAFKRISLQASIDQKATIVHTKENSLIGKQGISYTVLRPSGKVMINHEVFDASTRGEYIEKNEAIEVISEERISIIVKKVE